MELSDIVLRNISSNLGSEWEKLASYLGFSQAKIEQFIMEGTLRGIENAMFSMLVAWRETKPVQTTNYRKELKSALEKCGRSDLADLVHEDSPKTQLDAIYSSLCSKLENKPELFENAINAFYTGYVSMTTDSDLAAALINFGQSVEGTSKDDKLNKEEAKQAVPKWKKSQTISKRNEKDAFQAVTVITLHPSGDIALLDKNDHFDGDWNGGKPRIYGFNPDGWQKFVLNSTRTEQKSVGKIVYGQGLAVTKDGKYIVADGTTDVKVFDADGTYLTSFSAVSDDFVPEGTIMSSRCLAVNDDTEDVVVGDWHRELVTVHNGEDFKIVEEIPVEVKPMHVAVNKKRHIAVCVMFHEPAKDYLDPKHKMAGGKVVAFDYSGDELYTIFPIIGNELAKPCGIVYDSDCGLYVAVTKFDIKSRLAKLNAGHIHYYNSSGEFVKCVAKGLYRPMGIGLRNGVLAVADKKSAKVYKPE